MKKAEDVEDVELYLPSEITENILSRLPVKSVVRFKCLSKSWCCLISSHQFAKKHMHLSSASPTKYDRQKLITWSKRSSFCGNLEAFDGQVRVDMIVFSYQKMKKKERKKWMENADYLSEIRFRRPNDSVMTSIRSANGLCCLCLYSASLVLELFIFNPSISVWKKIPLPDFMPRTILPFPFFGFGYSHTLDDYKIVILQNDNWSDYRRGPGLTTHTGRYEDMVYVYSLKNNSWKRVQDITGYHFVSSRDLQVIVNEAIHWIFYGSGTVDFLVTKGGFIPRGGVIRAFDLVKDKFSEISLPSLAGRVGFLSVYKDTLCVFPRSRDNPGCVQLWVLREYGRNESCTKIQTQMSGFYLQRSLGFCSDDEIVNIIFDDQKLALCNTRTGIGRNFDISGLPQEGRLRGGCICAESLISPTHYEKS